MDPACNILPMNLYTVLLLPIKGRKQSTNKGKLQILIMLYAINIARVTLNTK